jgi:hypothetical protein
VSDEGRDEPKAVRGDPLNDFLYDLAKIKSTSANTDKEREYMIAIGILDAFQDTRLELSNKDGLLIWKDRLNRLSNL